MPDFISDADALAFLTSAPEPEAPAPAAAPEPAAAAPEEVAPQSEAEPTAEDAPAPEEPASEDAPPAETPEAASAPSIEAPHFWDAQAKANWSSFSPEQQSVIAAQAKNGERAVTKVQQEAADARKAADEARTKAEAEATSFADLNKRLGETVTDKKAEFNARWKNWLEATPEQITSFATENPDQYTAAKAAFDAESAQLQRLEAVKHEADAAAQRAETERQTAWAKSEGERLKTLDPELADPKQAAVIMPKLMDYAAKFGVKPEQIRGVDALTLTLARKAMLWDELQASAKTPTPPRPASARPQARPAPAPAAPPQTSASALRSKGAKQGFLSDADALALIRST